MISLAQVDFNYNDNLLLNTEIYIFYREFLIHWMLCRHASDVPSATTELYA